MPAAVMLHETDPRQVVLDAIGDLSGVEVFNNQVLCAVYLKPERTKGGIFLTEQARDEDKSQGKVALVVKMGDGAFKDETGKWNFPDIKIGDWVYFRASDGWAVTINEKLCRVLDDINVRGRIQHPDQVW